MSANFAEPLDTSTMDSEVTDSGRQMLEGYRMKTDNSTDKEMLENLSQCNGNHYWTQSEKECLIYFLKKCGNDLEKLQEDFFPHRSIGALKTRYTKIIRGEDTPATTPRLSVGNIISSAANEVVKAVTPRKPIKAIQEAEIEEEEEEIDEDLNKKELPEVAAEEAAAEPAATAPETKTDADKPMDITLLAIGPIVFIYLFIIAVTILPEESLPMQLITFKQNLQSNLRFVLQFIKEKLGQ